MGSQNKIPKIPHLLFKWYCRREMYEELHGDLEEFYYERCEEQGRHKAVLRYYWDVIRCCQPYAWKPMQGQNSNIIMFRNYFKTSIRSLMKNPLSSFINVFGLSMGIGICLLAYGFLEWEYNLDQFHENKNEVFLATFYADHEGGMQQFGTSPEPLAQVIKNDYPSVRKTCRVLDNQVVVKNGDKVFYETARYTDPEFLQMLTFPIKWGTASSLEDINTVILSDKTAQKYFGEANPIGKDLIVNFDANHRKTFQVGGVAMPFPRKHAIGFDLLINFENAASQVVTNEDDWGHLINATLIQVSQASDIHAIKAGMDDYLPRYHAKDRQVDITSFDWVQLTELSRQSRQIRNDISFQYPPQKYVVAVFSVLVLILACLNYINIAIGSATKRLKEIGLRKTIGASKGQVVFQFLAENLFVTLFALAIGLVLSVSFIIPTFNQMFDMEVSIEIIDTTLWVFLLLILLLSALISGLYPALYISRFKVVKIFKGTVHFGKRNMLTKTFLGLQLILTCICVTCGVVLTQNTFYLNDRSWGYDQKSALYAQITSYSDYVKLKTAIEQNPNVVSMAGSEHHLGKEIKYTTLSNPVEDFSVRELAVDPNYLETMGLNILEGRFFEDRESDYSTILVNETFVRDFGIDDPIGKSFKVDSTNYKVIGVVADFHMYNFENEITPTVFSLANEEAYQYLSIKVTDGDQLETYIALQEEWAELFPHVPFQGGFQSEVFGTYVEEARNGAQFIMSFAVMSMILVSLGFYGLVNLNVAGRVREFSIRKVLGARLKNITTNISDQYIVLLLIGLFVGMPLSYFINDAFLGMLYHYHMPMSMSPILISTFFLVVTLFAVIGLQVNRVLRSNPADGLRAE